MRLHSHQFAFLFLFIALVPTFANNLAREASLYLRNHADNPVDWHAWNPASLAKAEELGKPILISIGYSSCHWCHVMEEESFMDEETAAIMNRHFFCIKIDKEELPEVDHYYMQAVQRMSGQGGWPLNVFCLPDGRPFFGGTYFPPDSQSTYRPSWNEVLESVHRAWEETRSDLTATADRMESILEEQFTGWDSNAQTDVIPFEEYTEILLYGFDTLHGGLARSPKFPPTGELLYLLEARNRLSNIDKAELDNRVRQTLDAMANRGLNDHIRGGFYRYSVTRDWSVPHFEKMLYDNAGFIRLYANAWLVYRNPRYREVVEQTSAWLMREMALPGGGFSSALNADSEGGEGLFYLWEEDQLKEILGDEYGAFKAAYNLSPMEHGGNHLRRRETIVDEAQVFSLGKLFKAQSSRPMPSRDEKVITSWNALAIGALAEAGWILEDDALLKAACWQSDSLWKAVWDMEYGLVHMHYKEDDRAHPGNLNDYVFLAHAMITLAGKCDAVRPGYSSLLMDRIELLVTEVRKRFGGPQTGMYFAQLGTDLPTRFQIWADDVIPSALSLWADLLIQLRGISLDADLASEIASLENIQMSMSRRSSNACAYAMRAHLLNQEDSIVVKVSSAEKFLILQGLLNDKLPNNRIPVFIDPETGPASGYQVCIGERCLPDQDDPVETIESIRTELFR